jgi:hypothetical protein
MYPHVRRDGVLHLKMMPGGTLGEPVDARKIKREPLARRSHRRRRREASPKPRRVTHPGNIGSYGVSNPGYRFE